jgi:predicted membrane chloride channel (bestrophin family)
MRPAECITEPPVGSSRVWPRTRVPEGMPSYPRPLAVKLRKAMPAKRLLDVINAAATSKPASPTDRLLNGPPPSTAPFRAKSPRSAPNASPTFASGGRWMPGLPPTQMSYDAQESILASVTRWRGSVLPMITAKPVFWLLLTLHWVLLGMHALEWHMPAMDTAIVIGLPASLLIFLTVFYNGNCYTRYYELWAMSSRLVQLVHSWVLQVSFIFHDLVADGRASQDDVKRLKWRAARRILSALQLLFMALDAPMENPDCLGRPERAPNIMGGDGVEEEEFVTMRQLSLLSQREVNHIRRYSGLKCLVPIKWALVELHGVCKPDSRMSNQARNYEELQNIAAQFNQQALAIVSLQSQQVPYVYFHVLKIMMLIVCSLISYDIVSNFGDSPVVATAIFVVCTAMLIGLQEIAAAMADPFGTDDTDFDTRKVCEDAYLNAVAYLQVDYPPDIGSASAEHQLINPLDLDEIIDGVPGRGSDKVSA